MPPSVRRVFRLLDAMLTYAVVTRRLGVNPLDGIRLPEPVPVHPEKRRPPSAAQLRAVRRALPKHLRVLQLVAQETGLRWGEISGLRACWVDLDGARLHVREVIVDDKGTLVRKAYPKSEAGFRTVPLSPLAVRVLRAHMAQVQPATTVTAPKSGMHGEELVFRSRNNQLRGRPTPLNPSTFRETWHAAIKRAGVARVEERVKPDGKVVRRYWPNFHSQRKTFASKLHALGVPEAVVQEVLGHERAGSVTWLYTYAARDVAGQILAAMADQGARRRPFLRAVPESGMSPESEADSVSSGRLRAV
jgi:integrase